MSLVMAMAMVLVCSLALLSVAHAQIQCDKVQSGLVVADCVNALKLLGEDSYTLKPGFYMQEVYGTCKARVSNRGARPLKIYRDAVTLEFSDIIDECVKFNGHPGAMLIGNNAIYSLTSSSIINQ